MNNSIAKPAMHSSNQEQQLVQMDSSNEELVAQEHQ
jgi:hypothetical protein